MHSSTKKTPLPQVPARWAWHYQRLQSLHDRLLENRTVQTAEVSEPLEPYSQDIADSATDEFDHDMLLGILSHEQDALYELEAAMRRILDGSYGTCEESGRPIPADRLRAVPWARHTQEVEERQEREARASGTHLGEPASLQHSIPEALSGVEEPDEQQRRTAVRHQHEADLAAIESGTDNPASMS